jgi:hypothetical protein
VSALDLVPDWVREWAYRRVLCSEAWRRGARWGWDAGRRALLEEQAEEQRRAFAPVNLALGGPDQDEQWGPGGRGHFGDPRPGDYPGGPVSW